MGYLILPLAAPLPVSGQPGAAQFQYRPGDELDATMRSAYAELIGGP